MELVYTDNERKDVNILHNYYLDFESGLDSKNNTFEIKVALDNNVLHIGDYFYIDGTEYGGKIDSVKIDTAQGEVAYSGRTWRGILGSKILCPSANQDYYIESGSLKAILGRIISRIALSDLFTVSSVGTDRNIPSFQFDRYIDAYKGITDLLKSVDFKLSLSWNNQTHKVVLNAVPIFDFSDSHEVTSDMVSLVIEKKETVNHMIGLGKGELKDRQVVHKYLNGSGLVVDTQYFFNSDEVVEVYDYSSVESLDELKKKTAEALEKKIIKDAVTVNASDEIDATLGDKFTVREIGLGITATQYVNGIISIITEDTYSKELAIGEWIR